MSAREIIQELDKLSPEELREVQRHLVDLTPPDAEHSSNAPRLVRVGNQLFITGDRIVYQSEVDAILADFP